MHGTCFCIRLLNILALFILYIYYVRTLHYAVNDYFLLMTLGDLLLRNPAAGIDINIIITDDGIAGEPPESFTITYQQPTISSNADPLFLFRNTTVTIMDTNSK